MEEQMKQSNPESGFANVNGIRLHYLDWGGCGPVLLFLTGMGSSAYIFSKIAPRFTDRFHVLALTRRGHGDSDYPETGYDANTLTEDLRQFMDCLGIQTASLAGHSLAGVELTHFAATYPQRVDRLIYLDALDDRRWLVDIRDQNPLHKIEIKKEESSPRTLQEYNDQLKKDFPEFAEIWSELWDEEMAHGVKVNEDGVYVDRMPASIESQIMENLILGYEPKKVETRIPMLCFYSLGRPAVSDAYTPEQKSSFAQFHREVRNPYFQSFYAGFQEKYSHARIIEIPDGHHYCFIAQEELVYEEMRKFLLE
jgi:pimeloyl-ACP methyl ester carboxylesterase